MKTTNETNQAQDQELAAFTDALLAGQPDPLAAPPSLAQTVKLVSQTITPQPPPEHLRRKIKQRIAAHWASHPAAENAHFKLRYWLLWLFKPSKKPWAWAIVTAAAMLTIVVALLLPTQTQQLTGTAVGNTGVVGVVVLVLISLAVVGWLVMRRK